MHVPQKLRAGRAWDPDAIAMLTDVTPTLYELLGYGPVSSNEVLGRPLLRTAAEPEPPQRDMYLMQSSYSRIYGLLDGRGEWLYSASANQVKEEFFDLRGHRPTHPIAQSRRAAAIPEMVARADWESERVLPAELTAGAPLTFFVNQG